MGWFALLWVVLAMLLAITIVGLPLAWLMIVATGLWVLYRIIRGWLALNEQKPISAWAEARPTTFAAARSRRST